MPNIPRFYSTREAPDRGALVPASPSLMSQVAGAVVEAGETAVVIGSALEKAAEAERILNTHYQLRDDFRNIALSFRDRTDYENFDRDLNIETERLRNKYRDKVRTRAERLAFDRTFYEMQADLQDVLTQKKATIITNNAMAAFGRTYDEAIEDAAAGDDIMKEAMRRKVETESEILVQRGIMSPVKRDEILSKFDSDVDESRVRNIGLLDPMRAYEMLMDKSQLTGLSAIKRAQLTEHMEARIRMEDTRLDRLTRAIQRENQAKVINDWADGKLTLETLREYRKDDPETGRPGLSDEFFLSMWGKVKSGKDVITDQKVFNDLYLKEDLTREDVDAASEYLSVSDTRILLNRILQERREEKAESRRFRQEMIAEARRERAAAEREKAHEERIERERRAKYASDARSFMKKAFNEYGIKAEEGIEMLRVFQGYVDDKKIPSEELADYALKIIEARKGGIVRQLWNSIFGGKPTLEELKQEQRRGTARPPVDPEQRGIRKRNPDGTYSSEVTIPVEHEGKWYIIPSTVGGIGMSRVEAESRFKSGKLQAVGGPYATRHDAVRAARERAEWLEVEEMLRGYGAGRPTLDEIFRGFR